MKGKNIIRVVGLTLIILFTALYLTQLTGYYQYTESQKNTLTKEAIERFEKDVSEGKEISAKNYLEEEKNYNNSLSTTGMKLSKVIEKGFNKVMSSIFNEINKTVNDK